MAQESATVFVRKTFLLILFLFLGQASSQQDECIKDLLLIVDTSYTIGEKNFANQIKPFLMRLVGNKNLNVGKDGTHIALMLFSSKEKTVVTLPFYEAGYTKAFLNSTIARLEWEKVKGHHTRTDLALEMATEIFSSVSPANHREHVDDVIVLITDGEPQGVRSAAADSKRYARLLKSEKNVFVIGVGVGKITTKPKFVQILVDISSPGQTITKANFQEFNEIMGNLVTKSCQSDPGYCTCPSVDGSYYLRTGETTRRIHWKEPIPSCGDNETPLDTTKTMVNPPLLSPYEFTAGDHSITYMYFFKDSTEKINCSVHLKIEACPCLSLNLGPVAMTEGGSTQRVFWKEPKPQCKTSLKTITPVVKPGDSFPIGPHTINYVYNIEEGLDITCRVNFEVKGTTLCRYKAYSSNLQECCCGAIHAKKPDYKCCGVDYYLTTINKCCPGVNVRSKEQSCYQAACKCPSVQLAMSYIKQGDSGTAVTWKIPQPSCQHRSVTIVPQVTPGDTFPVGSYNIKYSYKILNRGHAELRDLTCSVMFQVQDCRCPSPYVKAKRVEPGSSTMKVYWTEPRPDCPAAVRKVSGPRQIQGDQFKIGRHSMAYVYSINGQFSLTCRFIFEVKGALCGSKGYNSANQVCCCGAIFTKESGFQCCGQDYFASSAKKCCPNSVVRYQGEACPTE